MTKLLTRDDRLLKSLLAVLCVVFGHVADAAAAGAEPAREVSRGELLYSTHCIGCHGTQIHWREKSLVSDWPSLQAQVIRWQGVAGLKWSNEDIAEVARYLNSLHYHFPAPQ
jgi:mono/diheme cytochrome c family protein